jgi:hypothetical protein
VCVCVCVCVRVCARERGGGDRFIGIELSDSWTGEKEFMKLV